MAGDRSRLLSLLLIAVLVCCQASVVVESGPLNGTTFRSAEIFRKGDDYNVNFAPISGPLVLESSSDVSGKIVYIEMQPSRELWFRVMDLRDRGAIAVVHGTDDVNPGREYCSNSGQVSSEIQIRVTGVKMQEFEPILSELNANNSMMITLTSEGNPWTHAFISLATDVYLRGICGAASIGLIGFGLWKLIMFVKRQGSHFNVPQVCLALEIIANMWRVIAFIVDPIGCYHMLPTVFSNYANAGSLPFSAATFVLVTFYWHEIITDASINIHPFLHQLKIPFFVIMLSLIALDVILTISSYYMDFAPTAPVTIVYLVISTAFLIFYIVTAVKISIRMRKAQKIRKIARLSRVTSKMILNAASRGGLILAALCFALLDADPMSNIITIYLVATFILFDSFCRIFLFDIPPVTHSSASNNTHSNKSTNITEIEANNSSIVASNSTVNDKQSEPATGKIEM